MMCCMSSLCRYYTAVIRPCMEIRLFFPSNLIIYMYVLDESNMSMHKISILQQHINCLSGTIELFIVLVTVFL